MIQQPSPIGAPCASCSRSRPDAVSCSPERRRRQEADTARPAGFELFELLLRRLHDEGWDGFRCKVSTNVVGSHAGFNTATELNRASGDSSNLNAGKACCSLFWSSLSLGHMVHVLLQDYGPRTALASRE